MPTLLKSSRLFSNELMSRYRQQGDAPADAVITAVIEAGGPASLRTMMAWLADTADFSLENQSDAVRAFFARYGQLPDWADKERMARGMAFFKKHAGQIGVILGCFSLPYCYLGANGAQVLWLTERIKHDTTRRLQETGEWVFGVNNPKEWVSLPSLPAPLAMARTLKVRLIHAGARWFALHSGRWNMDWGYPVNQEDMAGTNLAFSYVVLRGLRRLEGDGAVAEKDEEDYLHHINVIAHINGVADELLPANLREAYQLDRAIAQRQFAPSEAGMGLTRSLLNAIATVAGTASDRPEAARNLAAAQMRFFLGDDYADTLGIPAVPVEKRIMNVVSRLPIFPNTFPR
jgi:hypothetical protein